MGMEGSIHGSEEYQNFHYTFTFSTIVAILPWIYMIPTVRVMLKICKTYLSMKVPPMDKHIFICILLNFVFSFLFFFSDYLRLSLPSTGLFTSWCASIQPNHFFKIIFMVTFYSNYCVLMLPFFLCLFRLTILLRPRDNSFICPKILKIALPLLFLVPLGCTAFMIPAVGYCRSMGPPLEYGAIYIYYSGGWSGWRNSYIHLAMSIAMCALTIACSTLMLLKLRKATAKTNNTSANTKKATTRAETSLTITMVASMIPFINNTFLTIVYLNLPGYVYYLMVFRPFGNDIETVMMPWILYLTHPMFKKHDRRISVTSSVSVLVVKSAHVNV